MMEVLSLTFSTIFRYISEPSSVCNKSLLETTKMISVYLPMMTILYLKMFVLSITLSIENYNSVSVRSRIDRASSFFKYLAMDKYEKHTTPD